MADKDVALRLDLDDWGDFLLQAIVVVDNPKPCPSLHTYLVQDKIIEYLHA